MKMLIIASLAILLMGCATTSQERVISEREEAYSDVLKFIRDEHYTGEESRILADAVLEEWDK